MPIIRGVKFTEKDRRAGHQDIRALFEFITKQKVTNLMFFMIERLPLNVWITYQDIADTFGVNKTNVNKYVRNLVDLQMVEKRNTRPVQFRLITRKFPKKKLPEELGVPIREQDFTKRSGTLRGRGRGIKRTPIKK